MTVGASRAGPTITRQPALAPAPQPRPAPTARALPPKLVAQGGQNWTPIEGQIWKPIDSEFLRCPWHGWEFEIATGQSYCDPKTMRIRQFEVAVAPGEELVKGPYVAENFPVSVEEDYLVVEV